MVLIGFCKTVVSSSADTLIIGDDGSACLIFKGEEGNITEKIQVIDNCDYDQNSKIYKWNEPIGLPAHLKSLVIINNTTNNTINNTKISNSIRDNVVSGNMNTIINNFDSLKVSEEEDFFRRNYKPGGMCSLKEMKNHPEWIDKYMDRIETKKVQICKSCRTKWRKGCCGGYSRTNRVALVMVIGWHK